MNRIPWSFDIWLLWGYFCRNEGGANVGGENVVATADHQSQRRNEFCGSEDPLSREGGGEEDQAEQESDQGLTDKCEQKEAGEGRSDGIGETGR